MSMTRGGSWFMLASKAAKADINSSNSSSLIGIGENRVQSLGRRVVETDRDQRVVPGMNACRPWDFSKADSQRADRVR
jgi:hypothetical protein